MMVEAASTAITALPLGVLGFSSPLALIALVGLGLPWLIHRINRARPIAWNFPSIRRIRSSPLPRQGRRKISDLLLMALRMLLFTLLIGTLAGPYWMPDTGPQDGPKSQVIFIIDASSSMSGWEAKREALTAVRSRGADISDVQSVEWLIYSDRVEAASDSSSSLSPSQQLAALQSALAELEIRTVAGRPDAAIREALRRIQPEQDVTVVLVSDFQATDWSTNLPQLPAKTQLEFIRVGTENRNANAAILDVRSLPSTDGELRIRADIMNFGNTSIERLLELRIGAVQTSATVSLPAREATSHVFRLRIDAATSSGEVTLRDEQDPYLADNRFVFRATPPPPLTLFALLPSNPNSRATEEVFFLEQALEATSRHEWLGFSVLPTDARRLDPQTLQRIAAVFVPADAAGELDESAWTTLAEYVDGGGLVIMTLGDTAVRGLQRLASGGTQLAEYIGRAGRGRDLRQRFFAGALPETSPLAQVFEGEAARDLFLMSISAFAQVRLQPPAQVWMQSEEGFPLIFEVPVGNGRWIVSTFPWHSGGGDFPLRSSFLPIVREAIGRAPAAANSIRRLSTHAPLAQEMQLAGHSTNAPSVFTFQDKVFEVNVPRSESVIDTIPAERLQASLQPGSGLNDFRRATASNLLHERAVDLRIWFLLALVGVWIIESLLAAWLVRPAFLK